MNAPQWRVLYRQFLFRLFDREVLSPKTEGDTSRLFGQLAALLVFVSAFLGFYAIMVGSSMARLPSSFLVLMIIQHFLIATTMLAVGLFAVLSWDGIFPDRRDSQVLGALPVSPRTMFMAKVSAVVTALGLTVILLHSIMGLVWPFVFSTGDRTPGFRSFAAYWTTMLLAGLFAYGIVLTAQGLAAQLLSRRIFLRFSGYLQLSAVCTILTIYFAQPGIRELIDLAAGSGAWIQWLPSCWFLALYQQLSGSMLPGFVPLAHRAWIASLAVSCGTPVVYGLSYWRTLAAIAEEPDIVPTPPRWRFLAFAPLARFGGGSRSAITQFSVRTIARSRQHRLILSFYLGLGLAFTILQIKGTLVDTSASSVNWSEESMRLWGPSLLVMLLAVVGTRVAFALPLDLRANWIFRVIGVRSGPQSLSANRRALLRISVIPVWLVTATILGLLWPGRQTVGHLIVLGLFGLSLVELCLLYFRKIPFTCSWLPGNSRVNMVFVCVLMLVGVGRDIATFERNCLQNAGSMMVMLSLLAITWLCIRRTTAVLTTRGGQELQFDEVPPPELLGLGLYQDGVMAIEPRSE